MQNEKQMLSDHQAPSDELSWVLLSVAHQVTKYALEEWGM